MQAKQPTLSIYTLSIKTDITASQHFSHCGCFQCHLAKQQTDTCEASTFPFAASFQYGGFFCLFQPLDIIAE